MKILTISNIHGRYDEFVHLLKEVSEKHPLESFDKIILLGDYIVYGKKNKETIELLLKMKNKFPNLVLLLGNWETSLYNIQRSSSKEERDSEFKMFARYGQVGVLKELRSDKNLLNTWLDTIGEMPIFHVEDDLLFSHAGVDLSFWIENPNLESFIKEQIELCIPIWAIQNHLAYADYLDALRRKEVPEFPFRIVCGQTAINKILSEENSTKYNSPFVMDGFYGIDFGAIYSKGRLGAVVFNDDKIETFTVDVGFVPQKTISNENVPKVTEIKNEQPTVKKTTTDLKKVNDKKKILPKTTPCMKEKVLVLFIEGVELDDIAKKLNITLTSVQSYLIDLYRRKKIENIDFLYKEEHVPLVLKAFEEYKKCSDSVVKKHLPDCITYPEIKAIRLVHSKL